MRYWNKNPRARQHWSVIDYNVITSNLDLVRYFEFDAALNNAKIWCQRQTSRARFYFKVPNWMSYETIWYFEDPKDAIWFKLNWK